jgi:hypothetical protein
MNNKFSLLLPYLTIVILIVIYFTTSWIVSRGNLSQTNLSYYNYLLNALYHKHLDVIPYANATDLTWFNNKWYMYWGPAPILFISPFYLIFRTQTSDVLYTLAAGILSFILFYFVLKTFNKTFILKKSKNSILFTLINFALISPVFYLSLQGRIWHTNQVIAIFYLLLFFLFYFKFWQKPSSLFLLILATIFLNLAVLSRYTLVFYFSLFFPLIYHLYKSNSKKLILQSIFIIFTFSISFFLILITYNHARFGEIFETGVGYMNIRSSQNKYISDSEKGSLISPKYFFHNFDIYFLHFPKTKLTKPFLSIDKEGNSLVFFYPLVIFTPLLFSKKKLFNKKYSLFLFTSIFAVILPITLYLMFYLATGWAQLGTRYFLDAIPMLFILLLLVVDEIPLYIKISIIILGLFLNIYGSILFYQT